MLQCSPRPRSWVSYIENGLGRAAEERVGRHRQHTGPHGSMRHKDPGPAQPYSLQDLRGRRQASLSIKGRRKNHLTPARGRRAGPPPRPPAPGEARLCLFRLMLTLDLEFSTYPPYL